MAVYLRDGLADDVVPTDIVSEQVRAAMTGHVSATFNNVAVIAAARGAGVGDVDEAIENLGERPLDMGEDGADAVAKMYSDIEALMTEILEGDAIASLESLKTHNDYTFQHSVDVALVGILLGKRAGLPYEQLRELALGCLLHDIGKMYIDQAILDKPGKLTDAEFAEMQKHPLMGFELIRRMPIQSLLPAHVAYQHHERQNGTGYPRGLAGSNRVLRSKLEKLDPKRMLLIAEIGAVADVYSAISSDRPYRPAMPPDRVARVMTEMSGGHLNREVVGMLRQILPKYPVGHWVEVLTGAHAGWRGVVSDLHPALLDRPTVRLLLDERGEAVASPVEVNMRTMPEAELVCLSNAEKPTERVAA
jgi:HD-GYP domain-containing protein (c-di-GMP phosphodiesterase class II)